MISLIERNLNIHQFLKENINNYKEVFIEYYGEESREFIEHKFSHLATIGFIPTDSIRSYLIDIEKEISNEILEKQDFNTFPLEKEEIFEKYHLGYYSLTPIGKCEEFIDEIKLSKTERVEEYKNKNFTDLKKYIKDLTKEEFENIWQTGIIPDRMSGLPLWLKNRIQYYCCEDGYNSEFEDEFNDAKPLLEKLYPEINIDNYEQLISENNDLTNQLIELSNKARDCHKEYLERIKAYSKYYDEITELSHLTEQIKGEYFKKFITENYDLVTENEIDSTRDAINRNNYYALSDKITSIFGTSITSNTGVPVYAFSTDADSKINSDKTPKSIKNTIIKNRIRFFNGNGIILGNDYEQYLENEEAKKIWPSAERIDNLSKSFNSIRNEYNNRLYTSLSKHKELREEVDSLELLSKDDGIDAAMHTIPKTCVFPNIKNTTNGIELFPLVLIIPDSNGVYTDHKIVHELNHVLELSLTSIKENSYEAICGWDNLQCDYNDTREDVETIEERDVRPYEMINEIINEVIAQEISKLMQEKGIILADEKDKSGYTGYTSYERTFFIIKDFYKEFKDVILKSRRNGNIQVLFDEVGKENFDELNNLFSIFKDNFDSFSFGKMLMDRRDGKPNEKIEIFENILRDKDKILDKMKMYSTIKQETQNNTEIKQNTSVY